MANSLAQRIYEHSPVPLQTLLLNSYAVKMHLRQYTGPFRKALAGLLESQWWPTEKLREYQEDGMRRLVRHAYDTVPYYRRVMDERRLKPVDVQRAADLAKLPLLTRDGVKEHQSELISSAFRNRSLIHGHTSGTTGSPLQFYWDRAACTFNNAVDWRQKTWAGLQYGQRYAVLLGRMITPLEQKEPPFWRMNYLHNQLWLSAFHMSRANLACYIEKLVAYKPVALEGYPSTLYILARYLQAQGETLPLKAALTSSEPLLPTQRELMEKVYQCKVFDFYSLAERVVFATECEHHEGLHLNPEYGITEVLDEDGRPCPPDQFGRLVCTSLHNYAMPFIRYQTSDVSSIRPSPCSCGRVFPQLESIITKDESIVVTPDGRLVSPSVLTHIFKPLHGIIESQILQEATDSIRVRVVKGASYSGEDTRMILKGFKDKLGEGVNVKVEFVDAIERTAAGKFRWVISKVALPF